MSKAVATVGAIGDVPADAPVPGKSAFGNMPMPASSAAAGPGGAMSGATSNAVQRYAFEHKIMLMDQLGRPRHAPVFTTQLSEPTPSGMT